MVINMIKKLTAEQRKKIKWFPTIDYSKCIGCMACLTKCKRGVYANKSGRPIVASPYSCVVGCRGCEPVCPKGAISHPSDRYLTQAVKGRSLPVCCGGRNV